VKIGQLHVSVESIKCLLLPLNASNATKVGLLQTPRRKASSMAKAIAPYMPQQLRGQLFWTGQKNNQTLTRGIRYTAIRFRTGGSTLVGMCRTTLNNGPARGSPYTCPSPSLISRRIILRQLWTSHAYTRVNLVHPQGTHHFSEHFLHTLSQFHYWLERQSANVPANTFRPTAKTHRLHVGSRYRHTGAFSVTVATQPFLPDRSSLFWVYCILAMTSNSLLILDHIHKI